MTQPDGAVRDAHTQARDGSRRRDAGRGKKKMRAELRAELEREVAALRNEFLQDRLDAARGTQQIKAVQRRRSR